jgi:hypothetical protein
VLLFVSRNRCPRARVGSPAGRGPRRPSGLGCPLGPTMQRSSPWLEAAVGVVMTLGVRVARAERLLGLRGSRRSGSAAQRRTAWQVEGLPSEVLLLDRGRFRLRPRRPRGRAPAASCDISADRVPDHSRGTPGVGGSLPLPNPLEIQTGAAPSVRGGGARHACAGESVQSEGPSLGATDPQSRKGR